MAATYKVLEVPSKGVVRLSADVGLAALPNWWLQRARTQANVFNLLVIGAPGLGKSTLINSIFEAEVMPQDRSRYPTDQGKIEFRAYRADLFDAGVKLQLEVTETVGFGEIGHSKKYKEIVEFVEERHSEHFSREQLSKERALDQPNRLFHAAIFFARLTSSGLSKTDITLIKELQKRVNVVPVITKADTLTAFELEHAKQKIQKALKSEYIMEFPPIVDASDDEWLLQEAQEIRSHCPLFTVVGQRQDEYEELCQRTRDYSWGSINADKDGHNDLFYLQKLLIRSHHEFLKAHTLKTLYENYRLDAISKVATLPPVSLRSSISVSNDLAQEKCQTQQQDQQIAIEQQVAMVLEAQSRKNSLAECMQAAEGSLCSNSFLESRRASLRKFEQRRSLYSDRESNGNADSERENDIEEETEGEEEQEKEATAALCAQMAVLGYSDDQVIRSIRNDAENTDDTEPTSTSCDALFGTATASMLSIPTIPEESSCDAL